MADQRGWTAPLPLCWDLREESWKVNPHLDNPAQRGQQFGLCGASGLIWMTTVVSWMTESREVQSPWGPASLSVVQRKGLANEPAVRSKPLFLKVQGAGHQQSGWQSNFSWHSTSLMLSWNRTWKKWPTQRCNQGLLHCGWILWKLGYQRAHYIPKR